MPTEKTIRIPVYTYGKYRAQDGTVEEFTDELMRQLTKNTNYVISRKAFIPTVGYDHPVYGNRNTDAHGHIKAAVYENGVLSLDVLPIPDRTGKSWLIEDRKAGRRPHVSGEHKRDFSFVDERGRTEVVGPTILGLAALGADRPAIKNPLTTPTMDLQFAESVSAADAYAAREALRKGGVVSQTFEEGVLVFSEIQLSQDVDETPKEQPMTAEEKAEFQRMLDAQAATLKAGFDAQLAAAEAKTASTIKAMSEGEAERAKLKGKIDVVVKEKKLGLIPAQKFEEAVLNPTAANVLAFGEVLSAVVLPGRSVDAGDGGDKKGDEPKALATLKPRHFSDVSANESMIDAGLIAFGEFKPDAFKGVESNQAAQLERLRHYVTQRDHGDA